MPRFTEKVFVTASVPATSSLNHNEVIGDSTFDILRLKIVPSIVGVTSEGELVRYTGIDVRGLRINGDYKISLKP